MLEEMIMDKESIRPDHQLQQLLEQDNVGKRIHLEVNYMTRSNAVICDILPALSLSLNGLMRERKF